MKVKIKQVKNIDLSGFLFYVAAEDKQLITASEYEEVYNINLPKKLKDFIDRKIDSLIPGKTILITHEI